VITPAKAEIDCADLVLHLAWIPAFAGIVVWGLWRRLFHTPSVGEGLP